MNLQHDLVAKIVETALGCIKRSCVKNKRREVSMVFCPDQSHTEQVYSFDATIYSYITE